MKQETSGKSTRGILHYLESRGRKDLWPEVEQRFGIPVADLLNEYNWFSYDLKVGLLRYASEVLSDPMMPYRLGMSLAMLDASRTEVILARMLGSPERAYRAAPKRAAGLTRAAEVVCRAVEDGHAVMAYRVPPAVTPAREDCLYCQGVLDSIPDLFGRGPARSRHEACQVKGDAWCVYEVTWQPRRRRGRAARQEDPAVREAMVELEAKHRLLEENQFRLQELTGDLRRQVETRTGELSEANARLAQLNAFKDELLGVLSHDLRSSLASIVTLVEAYGSRTADVPVERLLAHIRRSAEDSAHLMEDLLDHTQLQLGRLALSPVALSLSTLAQAVVEAHRISAQSRELRVAVTVEPGLADVSGDRAKLYRALANVLGNALKFSPRGGVVEVAVGRRGGRQRIEVLDAGPGVPPGLEQRIFEPFVRADGSSRLDSGGIGLGLHIARQVLEAHGGRAEYERRPDGRSCFYLELPET